MLGLGLTPAQLVQRATFETINDCAAGSFADDVEASLRVDAPFRSGGALAVFQSSNLTVDAHAMAL